MFNTVHLPLNLCSVYVCVMSVFLKPPCGAPLAQRVGRMEVLKRAFFLIYNRKVAQQRVQVCGRKQTGEQALQLVNRRHRQRARSSRDLAKRISWSSSLCLKGPWCCPCVVYDFETRWSTIKGKNTPKVATRNLVIYPNIRFFARRPDILFPGQAQNQFSGSTIRFQRCVSTSESKSR